MKTVETAALENIQELINLEYSGWKYKMLGKYKDGLAFISVPRDSAEIGFWGLPVVFVTDEFGKVRVADPKENNRILSYFRNNDKKD